MNIIDSHIHTNFSSPSCCAHSEKIGVPFSWIGLQKEMEAHDVAGALIITTEYQSDTPGESKLLLDQHSKDKRLFPICSIHPHTTTKKHLSSVRTLMESGAIKGIKIFPGYHPYYPSDKRYHPFYELAGRHGIPVLIHTGDTFGRGHLVKYAHPLDVDEIAVKFKETTFILAHLGNPWVRDASELVYKNENVYADLSAFAISTPSPEDLKRITDDVRWAISYTARPDKFLYGSDWPLVTMGDYVALMKHAIPKEHHQAIFFDNANRIFKLGLRKD